MKTPRMKILAAFFCMLSFSLQAQAQNNCRYPYEQSADSLVKFVLADIYYLNNHRQVEAKFNAPWFKENFYNPEIPINYDSIFEVCIQHLTQNIGTELLCNNIDLYVNSFYTSKEKNEFYFSVGFTYPVLKREKPIGIGTFTSYYERINLYYNYSVNEAGKVRIDFPSNIPNCDGQPDCNISVTREKVMEILNFWGFIKENDTIHLEVNGDFWNVALYTDKWVSRSLKINIHTGKISELHVSHRID